MKLSGVILVAILFSMVSPLAATAQLNQGAGEGNRTQELVDHLKEVIREAEQERRSSVSITKQLKELVRRYDWPWNFSQLYDDFRDGDFTHNPRWVVRYGDFRVARGAGLRSYFEPPPGTYRTSDRRIENPALEILSDILIGQKDRVANEDRAGSNAAAEIFTRAAISNGFALKIDLVLRDYGSQNTRLEFGPYSGEGRSSGYRLAYDESGPTPSLSLLRFAPNRSAVIERVDQGIAIEGGKLNTFEWRRHTDGEMVVLMNGREVMRTLDRAYAGAFDGFAVINRGGEFDIKQVSILGTRP